jgi:hypothetical protein
MLHFIEMSLALMAGVFAVFVLSVFHAAAVEVSRKPRLAIVTNDPPAQSGEAEKEPELAVAA